MYIIIGIFALCIVGCLSYWIFTLKNELQQILKRLKDTQYQIEDLSADLKNSQQQLEDWDKFYNDDVTKMATDAGDKIRAWEQFYDNAIEDVNSVITMLDELMNKRQLISDDPEIQQVYRVVVILHDILIGYRDAKTKQEDSTEERKQESK
jgi:predicted  nucleic acid-binding Zn-ribbon protein